MMNLLLLISVALPAVIVAQETTLGIREQTCPAGYLSFGDKCYFLSDETVTFDDAATACEARGADLISLSSTAENNFISGILPEEQSFWIGLRDEAETPCSIDDGLACRRNAPWTWRDNTTYDALTAPWLPDMPANMVYCAVVKIVDDVFGWGGYDCTLDALSVKYICEKLAPKRQCNCTLPLAEVDSVPVTSIPLTNQPTRPK